MEPSLWLKPGREKTVLRRHPWIFSGAIARQDQEIPAGSTVTVRSSSGEFLAHAAYSPRSQITARVWNWREDEAIDQTFFQERIRHAASRRHDLEQRTNAMRLVNAESDGLPGLFLDRYAGAVVCEFLTAGADYWRETIADCVASLPGIGSVFERSDVDMRTKEGLAAREGLLRGAPLNEVVEVWEQGLLADARPWTFSVNIKTGHKTGFYLDQRDNRAVVAALAAGRDVLNVFAYTGAFAVAALAGGARSVTSIDSSGPALQLAGLNLERNGFQRGGLVEADAFKMLRHYRDTAQSFDMIILDPPKFANTAAQATRASRAYKDLNWLACRLLRPGGVLVTFSCSGAISEDLFQKILFGAALDAGRDVQIVRRLGQATDHPVLLSFPEAAYLKGFVCRVD